MGRSILPALGLLAFVSSSLCADTVLLPRSNTVGPLQSRYLIAGLLKPDTSTCSTALNCNNDPCCSDGNCCLSAQICCSDGGCCNVGSVCVTIDNEKGCCPIGQTCTASPGGGGGATTTNDGTTIGTTTTTGAGAGGTTTNSPTKTTTTAGGATRTQSAVTSTPTASAGFQVVVVDMSLSALTFAGSWGSTTSSSCSDGTSKSVSSDTDPSAGVSTVTYHFTGTAIYVKSASNNAHYMIQLDEDVTEYGGAATSSETDVPPNCTYGWWRAGLDNTAHTVEITVYGANQTDSTASQDAWELELQNFVVIEKTGSGSGSSGGSGSGSGSGAGTTTASVGVLAVLLMVGFWMILI